MNTQEIYKLAETINVNISKLTPAQFKTYESLVRLGDSEQLAFATVIGKDTRESGVNSLHYS